MSVGLVQPVEASARVRNLVEVLFGFRLNPDDCHTAFKVRVIPAGYCCRGDYVLIKAADSINLVAGRVVLHVQVFDTCISIVNLWTPIAYDPNNGYADWQTDLNIDTEVFPTSDILTSVVGCNVNHNTVRTLIPWIYRSCKPVAE